jgi:CubicO group peptidase (beta-lactamase class C family)
MTNRILGIVVAVACSVSGTAEATTNLKPFDPVALQGVVEATAKELLLPGAMVLLRTPQGDFTFGYGATELGGTVPPRADTQFRIASNTKTMTAAVIVLLAQEGKLRFDDPVSKYVEGVPNGDDITISEARRASGSP